MRVYVGGVLTWDTGLTPREQAVKVSEEVMEVFSAIEGAPDHGEPDTRVVDECCDVITATCNLLSMLGVTDLSYHMERCERRNRARGRL